MLTAFAADPPMYLMHADPIVFDRPSRLTLKKFFDLWRESGRIHSISCLKINLIPLSTLIPGLQVVIANCLNQGVCQIPIS